MNLRPKSIPGLIMIGLIVVALPLIIANARAFIFVDSLSVQSQTLVSLGVELMRDTETVKDELAELERSARQYRILGSVDLLKRFEQIGNQLTSRLELMKTMSGEDTAATEFLALKEQLQHVSSRLIVSKIDSASELPSIRVPSDARVKWAVGEIQQLRDSALKATTDAQLLVSRRMEDLQRSTSDARTSLLWQAFMLIPGMLVLFALTTFFVVKPIRQTTQAIRKLGDGELSQPVDIRGPAELASIGHELNWLRERLIESDQEKHQFLKRISHDLKTPLASVREGVELLHEELIGELNDQQREVAAIIRDSSVSLQGQIETLLNFNLVNALDHDTPQETFQIADVIKVVRNQHRLTLLNHAVTLSIVGAKTNIRANREKLRIALDNLISNAIKVSPENSTIRVRCKQRNNRVIIEVRDQGPGICKEDREFIFRPFYQGQTPQHTQIRGTGLGLSVARECINSQDGRLTLVQSDAPGACFRIDLPNHAQAAKPILDLDNTETQNSNHQGTSSHTMSPQPPQLQLVESGVDDTRRHDTDVSTEVTHPTKRGKENASTPAPDFSDRHDDSYIGRVRPMAPEQVSSDENQPGSGGKIISGNFNSRKN